MRRKPDKIIVSTFPQHSLPWLLTTAACGGLGLAPDRRTRRTLLHLSYNYATPFGPASLVTQDPLLTFPPPGHRYLMAPFRRGSLRLSRLLHLPRSSILSETPRLSSVAAKKTPKRRGPRTRRENPHAFPHTRDPIQKSLASGVRLSWINDSAVATF